MDQWVWNCSWRREIKHHTKNTAPRTGELLSSRAVYFTPVDIDSDANRTVMVGPQNLSWSGSKEKNPCSYKIHVQEAMYSHYGIWAIRTTSLYQAFPKWVLLCTQSGDMECVKNAARNLILSSSIHRFFLWSFRWWKKPVYSAKEVYIHRHFVALHRLLTSLSAWRYGR